MIFYIFKEKGNLKKAYKMHKASKKIKQQDLFNEEFYLKKYPNVKDAKTSPLNHYLYHGYKEGKQPGPLFDNNYYLNENEDVKKSGTNPLVHYVLHGKKEGRHRVKNQYSDDKEIRKLRKDLANANKKLKEANKEIRKFNRQIDRLQRKSENHFKILESYNKLFNDLYIHHETTSKGRLKDVQDLCLELLVFLDNICEKYDIKYWLDYGSLLGPIRHGGYLPWDDDMDLGMLKSDFDRFIESMNKEIKENGLEGIVFIREKKKYDETVTGFVQVIYGGPLVKDYMMGCIDILPYDYLKNDKNLPKEELKESISDLIEVTKEEFLEKEYFKKNPIEANDKLNEIVGIVDHESDYVIPSSVNLRPNRIRIYKTEEMFPLKKVKFEQYEFNAAREPREYLKMSYGNEYMKMPKNIKFHTRLAALVNNEDEEIPEMFVEALEKMRAINEKY